ncbi:MAG: hypothetical protein OHK0040_03710 [bacterium]
MSDKFTSKGFADMELETIPKVNPVLDNINKIIEWRRIDRRLSKKCNKSSASADVRPAYSLFWFLHDIVCSAQSKVSG